MVGIADNEQRWLFAVLAVQEELLVGLGQVLVLAYLVLWLVRQAFL